MRQRRKQADAADAKKTRQCLFWSFLLFFESFALRPPRQHTSFSAAFRRFFMRKKSETSAAPRLADGIQTHAARQRPFSALFALFVLTCAGKPVSQKTKIAQKRAAVGCKAVLPELIFVRARQSTQRKPDAFARVLTRHGLNPTCRNRHGFKSRQPTV